VSSLERETTIPRFDRSVERESGLVQTAGKPIPFDEAAAVLAASTLSRGSRHLLLGLLRSGTIRVFPGGGVGIEYGSLLKTSVRPAEIAEHVREVADHLRERRVDLLLVPGMSGYPIGSIYAFATGIPALLLKKQKLSEENPDGLPPGSFVIPSYTGEGDVVMSADPIAVREIVEAIVSDRLVAQTGGRSAEIVVRVAGADDIIDKATMARGISHSAPLICAAAITEAIARHRAATGDDRAISVHVETAAWVTPLIKTYNAPQAVLRTHFGIDPFAGLSVTGVQLDPPAIEIEQVGLFAFAHSGDAS
jgi:hypothetical protein